jgi:ribosomal protein S18 acetylase RimI-like enzyme
VNNNIEILVNAPELLSHFKAINEEWISEMFSLEKTDREVLENAQTLILDRGGKILYARHPSLGVVGTCALLKKEEGAFELTKMGVLKTARGLKVGEQLLLAVITLAKEMQIANLFLLTNHRCEAAIHLYRKNGFKDDAEIMRRYGPLYQRCDVAMRYFPSSGA